MKESFGDGENRNLQLLASSWFLWGLVEAFKWTIKESHSQGLNDKVKQLGREGGDPLFVPLFPHTQRSPVTMATGAETAPTARDSQSLYVQNCGFAVLLNREAFLGFLVCPRKKDTSVRCDCVAPQHTGTYWSDEGFFSDRGVCVRVYVCL